jgi:type II secretory pathway pseudopilin PulG
MLVQRRSVAEMCTWLRSKGQAGFTLIEALIATTVGLVVVGAILTFNVAQMSAMRSQAKQVDLQSSARSIADLFAREVRRAGTGTNSSCSQTVSTGVIVAQSSRLRFRADLNGTGYHLGPNEDVTYLLDFNNDRITRTDNNQGRTDILWSGAGITGSQILYFDSNGNQLDPGWGGLNGTQLPLVARVRLQLALTADVVQQGSTVQQIADDSVDVALRNRYFVTTVCPYVQVTVPTPIASYN